MRIALWTGNMTDTHDVPDDAAPRGTLERGLAIVETLARAEGALSVKSLAHQLGVPVSSLYRLLAALEQRGLISYHLSKGITLGPMLMELGLVARRGIEQEIGVLLRPLMVQLTQKHHESAVLMVPAADRAVCIEYVGSHHPVRLAFQVGRAMPLYAGSACKVILAYLPDSIRSKAISDSEGQARADGVMATGIALRHEVSEIRSLGYCVTEDEVNPGTLGVAVPVRLGRHLTGSITIAGAKSRLTPRKVSEMRESLLAFSQASSRILASATPAL